MKLFDFKFLCESFWSIRINECMRMCFWIRMYFYRMRIRNMRNSKKKINIVLLIFYFVSKRFEVKDSCDFSGGLFFYNVFVFKR